MEEPIGVSETDMNNGPSEASKRSAGGFCLRALGLVLLALAAPARAGDGTQIDWVGDWGDPFRQARQTGKPVMVCINSKDGEQANERAAQRTYQDPWFVHSAIAELQGKEVPLGHGVAVLGRP